MNCLERDIRRKQGPPNKVDWAEFGLSATDTTMEHTINAGSLWTLIKEAVMTMSNDKAIGCDAVSTRFLKAIVKTDNQLNAIMTEKNINDKL